MYDVLIIGGGIAGLLCYSRLVKEKYNVILLEKERKIGGQVIHDNPETIFRDLNNLEPIEARQYVSFLINRLTPEQKKRIFPQYEVKNIIKQEDGTYKVYVIHGARQVEESYIFKKIIFATGNGIIESRKLGFEDEPNVKNIFYSTSLPEKYFDSNILFITSGKDTLEKIQEIKEISSNITVVADKSNYFRQDLDEVMKIPNVKHYFFHEVTDVFVANNIIESIYITDKRKLFNYEIRCDAVIVNLGDVYTPKKFILSEEDPKYITVNENTMQTNNPDFFAIGDVSKYLGKVKRINNIREEIEKVVKALKRTI